MLLACGDLEKLMDRPYVIANFRTRLLGIPRGTKVVLVLLALVSYVI